MFYKGSLVIFFGGLGGIILSILHKGAMMISIQWILMYISIGLYIIGGIIYFIGGCAVANAYNSNGESSSFSGTWFAEALYVSCHSMIAGTKLRF